MRFKWALLIPGILLLSGCQHLSAKKDQCEQSIRAYNRMVRWQEYEAAENAVSPPVREEYRKKLGDEGLHLTDYRIQSLACDAEKGKAEAIVELDYYLTPSTALKTIVDKQEWLYFPDAFPGGWRLTTPPPDFSPKQSK